MIIQSSNINGGVKLGGANSVSNIKSSSLQQGLIAHYPLNAKYLAKDVTPNCNHGVITGATLTTDRFGQANKAYLFDGNDYITLPAALKNYLNYDKDFSISFRLYLTNKDNGLTENIFGWTGTNVNKCILIYKDNAGKVFWFLIKDGTNARYYTANLSLTNSTWYSFVFQYSQNSGIYKQYINAVDKTSGGGGATLTSSIYSGESVTEIDIGARFREGSARVNYFYGGLNDFCIYNRIITTSEITKIHNDYI